MNNELDWERVLEWTQTETTYLIHILIDPQQISIEVEDKYSGDIWHSVFSSAGIEELTAKARNQKKFGVFCKMLMSALLKSTESLSAQILSYRQLSSRFGKANVGAKNISPEQASKRFLILTYVGQFEKMQFPLPLMHYNDVTPDRLKLTIKRMAQEIHVLRDGQSQEETAKENSLLRYENQSLKAKLRNTSKMQASTFLQPRMEELQKEVGQKSSVIATLQQKILELQRQRRDYQGRLRESGQKIKELQTALKSAEQRGKGSSFSKNLDYYEKKIEEMMDEMKDLSGELAFARQKEKKGELRMATLQNELDRMMATKKGINNNFSRVRDSSSEDKKSERQLSVKSGRSGNSQKSQKSQSKNRNLVRKNYNTFAQNQPSNLSATKRSSKKKPSIYESDTESSRMRRMANSRSSPYRQPTSTQPIKKQGNSREGNINKSKSKERVVSPKPSAAESQMLTEGYQTDSSGGEELQRVEGYLNELKKKRAGPSAKTNAGNSGSGGGAESKVQKRLQNLEELIRKTAQSTRTRG